MPELNMQDIGQNDTSLSKARLYVYIEGTENLASLYEDADLTSLQANPVIADEQGEFPRVHVLEAMYDLRIYSGREELLFTFPRIRVRAAESLVFPSVTTMAANKRLSYHNGTSRQSVSPGELVHVTDTNFVYRIAQETATDHNVTASGGAKLYAQITSAGYYNAAQWNLAGDGITDDTVALQNAIDYAHQNKADLFIPAGVYLVTGLVLPGTVTGKDERGMSFRMFGQSYGEPFAVVNQGGTVLKSMTDAPVLRDIKDTDPSSNGTVRIDNLRIEANSDTVPAILLDSFYGLSVMSDLTVYQRGGGDGIMITYSATTDFDNIYVLNSDFAVPVRGEGRTGVGLRIATSHDSGLITLRKVTSRGFLTGFDIGGGAGAEYSLTISECECSTVTNGIFLSGTKAVTIEKCYMEGGDGGIGILDEGDYTSITNCYIAPGFQIGIDATNTASKGTLIEGNLVATGSHVNAVGIDVASSAAFGGYNKTVRSNSLVYTLGTDGVTGVRISGTEPRLSVLDNCFDPRSDWAGTGTLKIRDNSTGGICGLMQQSGSNSEFVALSKGALSFYKPNTSLSQASVTGGTLSLPQGSYFRMLATAPVTVNSFSAGNEANRLVIFRSENANMTIAATAQIKLHGSVNFTGPGMLALLVERIGSLNYAFEISRTNY